MASIDLYLDRICARLGANPAVAEDVRREIHSHLEDLIAQYCAEGMTRPEAAERAIQRLGDAEQIRARLGAVCTGETAWLRRLKGMVIGGLLGAALSLLSPFIGHGLGLHLLLNAAAGGCVGLFAVTRSRLVVGLAIGAMTWFGAEVGSLTGQAAVTQGVPLQAARTVLLSLVAGGIFGVAVAAGATGLLSLLSRSRPSGE